MCKPRIIEKTIRVGQPRLHRDCRAPSEECLRLDARPADQISVGELNLRRLLERFQSFLRLARSEKQPREIAERARLRVRGPLCGEIGNQLPPRLNRGIGLPSTLLDPS